jgi:hypothetical protein
VIKVTVIDWPEKTHGEVSFASLTSPVIPEHDARLKPCRETWRSLDNAIANQKIRELTLLQRADVGGHASLKCDHDLAIRKEQIKNRRRDRFHSREEQPIKSIVTRGHWFRSLKAASSYMHAPPLADGQSIQPETPINPCLRMAVRRILREIRDWQGTRIQMG